MELTTFDRSAITSSVRPSLKYSFSGSWLRFTNGSTTRTGRWSVSRSDSSRSPCANAPADSYVYLATKDVPAKGILKGDTLIAQKADDGTYYSWWANEVYFTCCDISADATDKLIVELQATDKAGNSNICWQDVLIEDKLPPRCET